MGNVSMPQGSLGSRRRCCPCHAALHGTFRIRLGRLGVSPRLRAQVIGALHKWCAWLRAGHTQSHAGGVAFFLEGGFYVLGQIGLARPLSRAACDQPTYPGTPGLTLPAALLQNLPDRSANPRLRLFAVRISNCGRSFMNPYSFDLPSLYEQECAGNAGEREQ